MMRESNLHRSLRINADSIGNAFGILIVFALGAMLGVAMFGN